MKRIWIPGWQFSEQAFQPLWHALGDEQASCLNYADFTGTMAQWLAQQVEHLTEPVHLIGWSLGGMLAYELAQRSSQVKHVSILNANVQFAGGPGLATAVADNFMARYQRNPTATRRRFASLVDSAQPESLTNFLLDGDRQNTLNWLYALELVGPLPCPVRVLLTEQDQLVPCTSAQLAWQALGAELTCVPGQHSLPVTQADRVAQWVLNCG